MTNQQPDNAPKTVTFKLTVKVHDTIHISEYSDLEIYTCFYGRPDFHEFRNDAKHTARMIAMKQRIDEECTTVRGVEHMIRRESYQMRSTNRKRALFVVMKEQSAQYFDRLDERGDSENSLVYDDEKIAAVYVNVTRDSAAKAYLVGLSDEMSAQGQKSHLPGGDRQQHLTVLSPMLKMPQNEPRSFHIRRPVFNSAA